MGIHVCYMLFVVLDGGCLIESEKTMAGVTPFLYIIRMENLRYEDVANRCQQTL